MPMTKRIWSAIGNSLLGIWIACAGAFSFCVLPHLAMRDLAPYTKTAAASARALSNGPYIIPAIAIVLTAVFYYRLRRNIQQTAISVAVLMLIAPFAATYFYWFTEQDFLDHYVVYQGNCEPLGVGVSTEGNKEGLYANFRCDDAPSYVFKVWDPEIIAYARTIRELIPCSIVFRPTTPFRR